MTSPIELAWDNHSSKTHPSKPENPGNDDNWVDKTGTGELPPYIERIKKHLMSDEGMTESRAIATAVNTVKKWAKGKNHNGNDVSAKTRKLAAAAVAEWNAKKAASGKKKDLTREPANPIDLITEVRRAKSAAKGNTIKGTDSFPIDNVSDLRNAIKAYGRAGNKKKAKAHIVSRAKALGKTHLLPRSWKARELARQVWAWLDSPVAAPPQRVDLVKGDRDNDGIPYEAKKNKRNNKTGFAPMPATPRPVTDKDKGNSQDGPAKSGTPAFNALSEPDQRRAVRQTAAARSDKLSKANEKQATKQAVAKTPQAAAKKLPSAVWQGRAQRLSRLSKESIARALTRKSDAELAALRHAIEGINDKVGKTGGTKLTGGDQGFYTFLKLLSKEQKKRAK